MLQYSSSVLFKAVATGCKGMLKFHISQLLWGMPGASVLGKWVGVASLGCTVKGKGKEKMQEEKRRQSRRTSTREERRWK